MRMAGGFGQDNCSPFWSSMRLNPPVRPPALGMHRLQKLILSCSKILSWFSFTSSAGCSSSALWYAASITAFQSPSVRGMLRLLQPFLHCPRISSSILQECQYCQVSAAPYGENYPMAAAISRDASAPPSVASILRRSRFTTAVHALSSHFSRFSRWS